jgi:hypothetical protein
MDTNTLHSDVVEIGQVFTPVIWAEWLIKTWCVYDAWVGGASVCDPTAGKGVFALALLRLARSANVDITQDLLSRLTLIEIQPSYLEEFKWKVKLEFGIEFPSEQLLVRDVIKYPPDTQYDILVGNPPWANFTDLPEWYKEDLKYYFIAEGLVPDRQKALLGSSRTDIAALVLKVVLGKLLKRNGIGCFFVPLSIFFGDDAHRGFRDYVANHRGFAVDEVYEFTKTKVFNGIRTAYCCARFKMDCMQQFPVMYFRQTGNEWVAYRAFPLSMPNDQWRVLTEGQGNGFIEVIVIPLLPEQKPRQGVNTCGANEVFIFNEKPADLPDQFIFPLATKDIWKSGDMRPHKWVLLPYDQNTGKPLTWHEIEQFAGLSRHLMKYRDRLVKRKGTLIQSAISKGIWWSLLGVGPYSFAPYKVIWEAYGKSNFRPIVLHNYAGQVWQANQAMQAFIPCWDTCDAKRICDALKHPNIQCLLQQLNGNGKCNWAQPGKIKKVMSFGKPKYAQSSLFDSELNDIEQQHAADGLRRR